MSIDFEEQCNLCSGTGVTKRRGVANVPVLCDCELCDGTGYVLTEKGKSLTAFIKRSLRRLGIKKGRE